MTTRRFPISVDIASLHNGRLRLHSGPMSISVHTWTPEQHSIITELLRARITPIAHLRIVDTHVELESVEAAEVEPTCNASGGVA